ncbi:MAG: methyltransferase domain-containing protein [Chloroflexi bacterium]|nr:methyltransferase domain-containing protein [Chloroflexota bacterium]
MSLAPVAAAQTGTPETGLYAHLDAADRYVHQSRDEALLALLRRHGIDTLAGLRILEVGCGGGSLLRTLLHYGADGDRLTGIDIASANISGAAAALPGASLAVANAAALPYRDASFDVAFAFTSLTSMLDQREREQAAAETLRVLRTGGLLVVYDFWVNPLNKTTRSLRPNELRALFAGSRVEVERVTLAPPIVRALGGRPGLCRRLERLPWLRSHLLAAVIKERAP